MKMESRWTLNGGLAGPSWISRGNRDCGSSLRFRFPFCTYQKRTTASKTNLVIYITQLSSDTHINCLRQRAPRCRRAPRRQRRRSGGPRPSRVHPLSCWHPFSVAAQASVELVMPATLSLAKVHFVWPIRSQIMRCNSGETLPAYLRRGRSASRAQKAHGQQPSSRSPRVEATDVPARRAA